MLKLKKTWAILPVMAGLLYSGCQTLEVPDPYICASLLDGDGGSCKKPLSGKSIDVPEPFWSTCEGDYPGKIPDAPCLPLTLHIKPAGIADYIRFVEQACNQSQNCVESETLNKVETAKKSLDELTKKIPDRSGGQMTLIDALESVQ